MLIEVEGAPARVDALPRPARGRGAAAGARSRRSTSRGRARAASAASGSSSRSAAASRAALVAADLATCADCLAELLDPGDRRHRYPFTNCTNCGPRFTIVTGRPLRPPADDDGRVRDVRRAAGPSTRIRATAASTPSPTPAPSAARGSACSTPRAAGRTATAGPRPDRGGGAAAARGRDRRGQGHRRLPPRLPSPATSARSPRCARASTARTKPFALMAPTLDAARELVELTAGRGGAAHRPASGRS